MIDCYEWKTEKRHECANMGKVKRLELWWQLYHTSLPDLCWTVCTDDDCDENDDNTKYTKRSLTFQADGFLLDRVYHHHHHHVRTGIIYFDTCVYQLSIRTALINKTFSVFRHKLQVLLPLSAIFSHPFPRRLNVQVLTNLLHNITFFIRRSAFKNLSANIRAI